MAKEGEGSCDKGENGGRKEEEEKERSRRSREEEGEKKVAKKGMPEKEKTTEREIMEKQNEI